MRDLTKGSPAKVIILFALPIILGDIFQQFYNLVDGKIVSTYIGTGAFAAVGATGVISSMMIGFINGLTQGFSISIAKSFGAKDYKGMRKFIAGSFILTALITAVMTIVSLLVIRNLLLALDTPEEILDNSLTYVRIILAGTGFTALYNFSANTLRAVGESRVPLLCLAASVALNIVLDILFVKTFSMGVAGAAHATNLAQLAAGMLCFLYLLIGFREVMPRRDEWKVETGRYRELWASGLSLGFMFCLVKIGTLIFQSAVNKLGTDIVTAHTAARKIDDMMGMSQACIGAAMTTYVGQNIGAGEKDRVRQGINQAIAIVTIVSTVTIGICWLFGENMVRWISSSQDPAIVEVAVRYLRINSSFFYVLGPLLVLRCALQGMGYKVIPLTSSILELTLKVVSTIVFVQILGYTGVIYTEPLCWSVMLVVLAAGYFYALKSCLSIA